MFSFQMTLLQLARTFLSENSIIDRADACNCRLFEAIINKDIRFSIHAYNLRLII